MKKRHNTNLSRSYTKRGPGRRHNRDTEGRPGDKMGRKVARKKFGIN